jgi:hypothetical protein
LEASLIICKKKNDLTKDIRDLDISSRLKNNIWAFDSPPHRLRHPEEFGPIRLFHLTKISKSIFSKSRNVGSKSIKELDELCKYYSIELLP